ncbi:uroporphyrinogen-III C-methyltransferase [Endozoicomonas ascidiicola]|uniref:uroporphyrinogen-III C-methyltransferase n=1 Tax=Endozoicomonas ascidiicola TaxID=1698521 RepID=UPI000835866C|nr:uroporphyrinogen-III C-methyltransferase [Endozoicomonas ascidiicola]
MSKTDQSNVNPPGADEKSTDRLPENKTKDASQKAQKKPVKTNTSSGRSLAGLSLILALGAIGLSGYIAWRAMPIEQNQPLLQESMNLLQAQVARQQARLTTVDETTTGLLERLQNQTTDLEEREERLLSRVDSLSGKVTNLEGSTRNQWHIGEVEFLLRLANQRLLTTNDTASALSLMESADQILDQMNEFSVFQLREALAEDIAVLKSVDVLDQENVWLRLHALTDLIPQLITLDDNQLTENAAAPLGESNSAEITDENTAWQQTIQVILADTWQRFTSLFRVNTDRAKPIEVLLDAEQDLLIRQKLILLLEQSKLALMTEQSVIYQNSLQQTIDWINQYFTLGGETTRRLLTELEALKALPVAPETPKIYRSLEALKDYQNAELENDLEPETVSPEPPAVQDAPIEEDDSETYPQGAVIS